MKPTAQHPSFEHDFRERLRAARERLGRSQADVARRAAAYGFETAQQPTIARIEAGERTIGLDEAAALAQAVDLSLVDMLWPADETPGSDADRSIREAEKDAQIIALRGVIAANARRMTGVSDLLAQSARALAEGGAIWPHNFDARSLTEPGELVPNDDDAVAPVKARNSDRYPARKSTKRTSQKGARSGEHR